MRIDLTQGGITRPMLLFAGPMIAGDLLQQCYNIADTLIVGRALGPTALAAVGFSFTLMTFLTSVLLGLCMGSGALWSMLYGAGGDRPAEAVPVRLLPPHRRGGGGPQRGGAGLSGAHHGPAANSAGGLGGHLVLSAGGALRGVLHLFIQLLCLPAAVGGQLRRPPGLSGGVHRAEHRPGPVVRAGPSLGGGGSRWGHGAGPGCVRRRHRPLLLEAGGPAPAGKAAPHRQPGGGQADHQLFHPHLRPAVGDELRHPDGTGPGELLRGST